MKDAAKLHYAIHEAERFLERARAVQAYPKRMYSNTYTVHDAGPKETGAARRASLDLTRALADLRRTS